MSHRGTGWTAAHGFQGDPDAEVTDVYYHGGPSAVTTLRERRARDAAAAAGGAGAAGARVPAAAARPEAERKGPPLMNRPRVVVLR